MGARTHTHTHSHMNVFLVLFNTHPGQLHARRVADGALELASAELRFRTDSDTGAPCAVICKQKVGEGGYGWSVGTWEAVALALVALRFAG